MNNILSKYLLILLILIAMGFYCKEETKDCEISNIQLTIIRSFDKPIQFKLNKIKSNCTLTTIIKEEDQITIFNQYFSILSEPQISMLCNIYHSINLNKLLIRDSKMILDGSFWTIFIDFNDTSSYIARVNSPIGDKNNKGAAQLGKLGEFIWQISKLSDQNEKIY
jgi:hypothetical protein